MTILSDDNKATYEQLRRDIPFDRYQKMRLQVDHRQGRVLDIGTCDFSILRLFQSFDRFAIDIVKHKAPLGVHFSVADFSDATTVARCIPFPATSTGVSLVSPAFSTEIGTSLDTGSPGYIS